MAGTEEAFRVRVCLERFFSDERARCYVSVRGARRVRWLARRLRALFPLPRRLALLSRGHLLPPAEPLALLRPDDPVQVIPATVEINEIDEDIHLATEATIEASTPESEKTSHDRKRRRKAAATDTIDSVPIANEYYTPRERSTGLSQEHELSVEISSDNGRKRNSKLPLDHGDNSERPTVTDTDTARPAATGDTPARGCTELAQESEPSDSERMRLLKEKALAALQQVETRARRRVRVRRRRKRAAPLPAPPAGAEPHPSAESDPRAESVAPAEPDERVEPDALAEPDERVEPDAPAETDERVEPDAPAETDERVEPDAPAERDTPAEPYACSPAPADAAPRVLRNACAPRVGRRVTPLLV